jgi:uncharacterized protein YciI
MLMNRISLAFALAALTLVAGCASTKPAAAKPRAYTLVLIKTGPQSGKLSTEENQRVFAGHFENMARLANERKLLVAGPYGGERHDKNLRGLFVLDTGDRTEATAWAETDPPTQAGVFVLEYHELRTDAALLKQLEHDLDRTAKAKAEGKETKPGEGARGYVLLTAADGELAHRELKDLVAAKRVYVLADLDKAGVFAILDAKDLAAARELLGPRADKLGAHTLDEWFASDSLETLVAD